VNIHLLVPHQTQTSPPEQAKTSSSKHLESLRLCDCHNTTTKKGTQTC
jgi:hypothetical protein